MLPNLRRNTAWIFFITGLLLLSGIIAYLFVVQTKIVQNDTERVATEAAETIQSNARLLFRDLRTFAELKHLAGSPTTHVNQEAITRFFQDRGTPFIYIESISTSGQVEYSYTQDPAMSTGTHSAYYLEKQRLLQQLESTPRFAVSDPFELPTGESAVLFAEPPLTQSTSSGFAIGVIPLSYFYNAVDRFCTATGYRFLITLPHGKLTRSPTGLCVTDPETTSTNNASWSYSVHAILIGNEEWEISVVHPTFRFQFSDIPSLAPFTIGGLIVIAVITLLIYHAERIRQALEAAIARENEFVSIVSHQLREPVSQMNAFIELLEDAWPPDAGKKSRDILEDLHVINQSNARLISNLLSVSRLQRGVLKPSIQKHVLKHLIEAALKKTDASRAEQQITVQIKPTGMATMVLADERLASDVIQNILDNAYKYSPKKSELTIKADATSTPSFIVLAITDKGPGIPASLQGSLFSKDRPRGAKTSGSGAGLGLYIAKKFMSMMGGDIRFKTSSKGTTFFLSFPKA